MPTTEADNPTDNNWFVYIILSSDDRLYTGITNNLKQRWHAHSHLKSGAKFFRGRSPKQLLFVEDGYNRSSASRRESTIKKLSRLQKLELVASQQETDWHTLLGLNTENSV